MKDLSTVSSDLFNKIRSRFSDVKLGDADSVVTTDPAEARFFDLTYKSNNKELGKVNIKVDDERITIIYNVSMIDNHGEDIKKNWFDFLKEIRQFARSNLLAFDTRDIEKSNLEKRDYTFLSQQPGEHNMRESKLFGTSKTSYQDVGQAKLIVRHTQPVNYNVPAGRTRHIDSIYIESSNGERFKYPYKHLNGARAMAVHVANGGNVYDSIGGYISGLSEELSNLRKFKNHTSRSTVMAEAFGDTMPKVLERIQSVKKEIDNLQKQAYYSTFVESFTPIYSQEIPEEMVNQWVDALTVKTFNEELKSVFPYIYKLVAETQALGYEDLINEVSDEEEPEEDEDEKEDKKEYNHLEDFEDKLDEIATPAFEREEDCECENCNCEDEMPLPPNSSLTKEVLDFIESFYDREHGTFPKGEEGVIIATGKKFGQKAEDFARYVVDKLAGPEQTNQDEYVPDDPALTELDRIKQLAYS